MINLRYRERASGPNTFHIAIDGEVILFFAIVQRTDVSKPFEMLLPCWIDERDRFKPKYDFPIFAAYRRSETAFLAPSVPFGPGDYEEIWLIEIWETIANQVWRAGKPTARQT